MQGRLIIPPTVSAAYCVIDTFALRKTATAGNGSIPGTLSLVGVLADGETVSVQIPAVASPDPDTPGDCTPLIQYNPATGTDDPVVFKYETRNVENITGNIDMRIVKTATSSLVGVNWS